MKIFLRWFLLITLACAIFFETGYSQVQHASSKRKTEQSLSKKDLFGSDDILKITLTGNIRELMSDKGDDSKFHPLLLSYKTEKDGEDSLSIQAKTRGHFRKSMGNCTYPPLLLQFTKGDSLSPSIFREQKKLKLVMPCRGDNYVIREWLVYKIYNLVTPKSFKARLVSVDLNDTKKKKTTPPFYGILLEEDQQMAKRNHDILIKKQLRPEQTDPIAFLKMAVFEYLIGNTDWSVQYQNIKLIAADSLTTPIPVPYDFDHAGIVEAPYAKPAEELEMNSVRERRYRGYCVADLNKFDEIIAFYGHLRADIYKLYTDCTLLDTKYVRETVQYLDEFYKTINDPSASKKAFSYPCDKNGTGNVVIKGLKDDHPSEQ
jgi:hypothetical protein